MEITNESLDKKIKNVIKNEYGMLLEFEDGEKLQLHGSQFEIKDYKICSFCNEYSEYPLFTTNDNVYICKKCTELAIQTFFKNKVNIDIKIDGFETQLNKIKF